MVAAPQRFDVFLIGLDPTVGSEIRKTRPCVIVSPNQMNGRLATVTIAPMTTKGRDYPMRVALTFQSRSALILLDQLRTMDKRRLIKKLGRISDTAAEEACVMLQEMFAY